MQLSAQGHVVTYMLVHKDKIGTDFLDIQFDPKF